VLICVSEAYRSVNLEKQFVVVPKTTAKTTLSDHIQYDPPCSTRRHEQVLNSSLILVFLRRRGKASPDSVCQRPVDAAQPASKECVNQSDSSIHQPHCAWNAGLRKVLQPHIFTLIINYQRSLCAWQLFEITRGKRQRGKKGLRLHIRVSAPQLLSTCPIFTFAPKSNQPSPLQKYAADRPLGSN
jgi:hypothetical protein